MKNSTKSGGKRTRARAKAKPEDVVTEGQRRLLELDEPRAEIAARVGVSAPLVSQWRTGLKLPGAEPKRALEEAFGIPAWAWGRPPGAGAPEPPESPSRAGARARGAAGFVSEVDEQIDILRSIQSDAGLTTSERVRVSDSITKLLAVKGSEVKRIEALRADVEREYEDLAVREAPFVRRLLDHIVEALRDHPDALRDVSEAVDIAMRPADGS